MKCQREDRCSAVSLLCNPPPPSLFLNVFPKIPHYSPSVCYQYQPFASPRHYYPEQEQKGMSPPLEVSDGEDEYEAHNLTSCRKDTSEYGSLILKISLKSRVDRTCADFPIQARRKCACTSSFWTCSETATCVRASGGWTRTRAFSSSQQNTRKPWPASGVSRRATAKR